MRKVRTRTYRPEDESLRLLVHWVAYAQRHGRDATGLWLASKLGYSTASASGSSNIDRLLQKARDHGYPIVWTKNTLGEYIYQFGTCLTHPQWHLWMLKHQIRRQETTIVMIESAMKMEEKSGNLAIFKVRRQELKNAKRVLEDLTEHREDFTSTSYSPAEVQQSQAQVNKQIDEILVAA